MSKVELHNGDNVEVMSKMAGNSFDLIYADMIYENMDFRWIDFCIGLLKPGGILQIQTDYHTVADVKILLDTYDESDDMHFVNWLIFINDWGGTPRKGFPQKHDDILVYSKGNDWYWNKEAIQIPKVTANTKFDKKGTGMKTPCSVFYDHASFSTMATERVKDDSGHNIRWQKPQWLMDRIISPFTQEGYRILDPFMGSGSLGIWCLDNNRDYVGIELDQTVFEIAQERLSAH